MKAVILCGGYAKRMWPMTKYVAKSLINVGGETVAEKIIRDMESVDKINTIFISTNKKFENDFKDFLAHKKFTKPVKLVVENTTKEEEKFGAVAGIYYLIRNEAIKEDLLIVGGDNILGFSLNDFIEFSSKKNTPTMAAFDIKDKEKAKIYGVLNVDDQGRIINFVEKSETPPYTLTSTCCFFFPKEKLGIIEEYLNGKNNRDGTGYLWQWLSKNYDTHAFVFDTFWFDIGDDDSLKKARDKFK